MSTEEFLRRLNSIKRTARGWLARCPAHADKSPSLSIRESDDRILLHCFAGCSNQIIVQALGLVMRDLFLADLPRPARPIRKPQTDLNALSFNFRLASLDQMLRAEQILEAATGLNTSEWTDQDFDVAINAVVRAYRCVEDSDRFNDLADDLRQKHLNRETNHAA